MHANLISKGYWYYHTDNHPGLIIRSKLLHIRWRKTNIQKLSTNYFCNAKNDLKSLGLLEFNALITVEKAYENSIIFQLFLSLFVFYIEICSYFLKATYQQGKVNESLAILDGVFRFVSNKKSLKGYCNSNTPVNILSTQIQKFEKAKY